jgi:hypothetical protein
VGSFRKRPAAVNGGQCWSTAVNRRRFKKIASDARFPSAPPLDAPAPASLHTIPSPTFPPNSAEFRLDVRLKNLMGNLLEVLKVRIAPPRPFNYVHLLESSSMSNLILAHVVTGLAGIATGLVVVAGIMVGRRVAWMDAVFILATLASCATGFVFLPTDGVTSAQLVAFFITFLLAIAAYARFVRQLKGSWNQVYALTAVGALFLNMLITTTQTFLHVSALRAIAPTEKSPVYVAVKLTLLFVFLVVAIIAARIAGRSSRE